MKMTPVTTCMFVTGFAIFAIGLLFGDLNSHATVAQVGSASALGVTAGLIRLSLL
jgi:hypothetical protein